MRCALFSKCAQEIENESVVGMLLQLFCAIWSDSVYGNWDIPSAILDDARRANEDQPAKLDAGERAWRDKPTAV